jgi:hypothetical protein
MASDTASPLTPEQRTQLWRVLGKTQDPLWMPTVDDCGVAPAMLQRWFARCNQGLRIYVEQSLVGDHEVGDIDGKKVIE